VIAILKAEHAGTIPPDNKVAMDLLRMALVLLDRDGEQDAATDVESALCKLGEPFPELTDLEASALLDSWAAKRRTRSEGGRHSREENAPNWC